MTIIAGTGGTATGSGTYGDDTLQTITATPDNYHTFSSWTGSTGCSGAANHTITMDANKTCTANFTLDPNWIAGIAATPLAGKYVRSTDLGNGISTYQYKTTNTAVASPQGATGLDPNYPSSMSLVSPQTNPGVDFSAYPAQNACKAIGGRLPNMQELLAVYAGKVTYGNNLRVDYYWSSTEYDSSRAHTINSSGTDYAAYKLDNYLPVRCVSG